MNATELMCRLTEYGADTDGIRERFMQDAEFYAECFARFLEDKNFCLLGQAIEQEDGKAAFAAAHSIKGLAGNMGLTALQGAVSELVELLRAGRTQGLRAQYAAVLTELDRLNKLYRD